MTVTFTEREIDLIALAHDLGREYLAPGICEAADDLLHASSLTEPAVSYEQRVADRVAEMERYAKQMPATLADYAKRCRDNDGRIIAAGLKARPAYRSLADVHASVDRVVWARIWSELAPSTRDAYGHLMPPGWRRGGAS
jgi:hypothetical protein